MKDTLRLIWDRHRMNSLYSKRINGKKSTENSNNTDAYDDFSPTSALTNQHISKKPPPPLIHLVQTATSAVPLCMNNGAHSARRVGKTKQKLNMSSADPRRPGWSCCQASLSIWTDPSSAHSHTAALHLSSPETFIYLSSAPLMNG